MRIRFGRCASRILRCRRSRHVKNETPYENGSAVSVNYFGAVTLQGEIVHSCLASERDVEYVGGKAGDPIYLIVYTPGHNVTTKEGATILVGWVNKSEIMPMSRASRPGQTRTLGGPERKTL